jgi:hypothetical protein
LFEYVPTEFEQQNLNEYNVKSPDRITYKPVSKLGLLNYILEYNYGGNIENSILVNAKNTPNPKVASQAASMDAVSNSILASFQAEEAAAYMQEEPQSLSTLLPPSSTPISTGMDFLQNAMDRSATLRADMQSEEGATAPQTAVNKGVEISSNAKGLAAALTNPTELAKSKGNLTQSYPIYFQWLDKNGEAEDANFKDVEQAYQTLKDNSEAKTKPSKENSNNYKLMVDLITVKLKQYPKLVKEITKQGGSKWILSSTHQPTRQNSVWETGGQNWFIESLNEAYLTVQPTAETSSSWNEYKAALTALLKLDKEVAMQQDFLSQEEFLSLPEKEQKAAIWQAKNCY